MKTISSVSTLILVLFIGFVMATEAQIPKEGTISYTAIYSGTFKVLALGEGRVQTTYEHLGVTLGDTGEDIFHNATLHCIGSIHRVKDSYDDDSGSCVITRPDGDKAFLTYRGTYSATGGKAINTLVGGTGKLTGLQGSLEATRLPPLRPASPGTYQGMSKLKGQYKLP
jgi:hypothetical protein